MCGRYVIGRATADLADLLDADPGGAEFRQSWNVAPSTDVPILLERLDGEGEMLRELHAARWGLLPIWARDLKQSYKTFNARSETVTEKPTFRSAVLSKRCAVPADAYYEWLKDGDQKRPHAIRPADGSLITFAGLYEWWRDKAAGEDAPWILSCTILTGPSPEPGAGGVLDELAGLHDRMPLALGPKTRDDWLSPGKIAKDDAALLVTQVQAEAMEMAAGWEVYEVDKAVGSIRNNGHGLLEPLTP